MSALSLSRRMGKRQEASVDPAWRVFLVYCKPRGQLVTHAALISISFLSWVIKHIHERIEAICYRDQDHFIFAIFILYIFIMQH